MSPRSILTLLAVPAFAAAASPAVGEGPRVRIETVDEELVGRLDRFGETIVLSADTNAWLRLDDVLRIDFLDRPNHPPTHRSSGVLELTDGSRIRYDEVEVRDGSVLVSTADGQRAAAPIDAFRTWRLDPTVPAESGQTDDTAADRLLVKRRGGATTEVEGVVLEVTGEGVRFALDPADPDGAVFAKWRRLAAIHFFRGDLAPAQQWVVTNDGARFAAARVSLSNGLVSWTSAAGARGTLPIEGVYAIDLAGDRVTPIADLAVESIDWRPFIPRLGDEEGVRFDRAFAGTQLSLRFPDPRAPAAWPRVSVTRDFQRGLALRSRGVARFRLPAECRQLKGWIGLDPATAGVGAASVSVETDQASLWEGVIDGDTAPVFVNESLNDARQLTLRVDYGDNLDTGDFIHFADLRVIQ